MGNHSDTSPSFSHSPTSGPQPVSIAGPFRRIAALGYDLLLLGGISLIYGAVALAIGKAVGVPVEQAQQPLLFSIAVQLGWAGVIAGFYCYFWVHGGQTLGMRAWRLRLVTPEGQPVRAIQAAKRCAISPFGVLLGGIGYWWCWLNSERKALHDLLSDTTVVCLPKPEKKTTTPST
ncbi:RDD family protein [Aurantivibrio plasticivorans]